MWSLTSGAVAASADAPGRLKLYTRRHMVQVVSAETTEKDCGKGEGVLGTLRVALEMSRLTARVPVVPGCVLAVGLVLATAAASPPMVSAAGDPVIAAVGDIACDPASPNFNGGAGTPANCRQRYTSNLAVGTGLTAVLPLGDAQYECGSLQAFQQSYDPSWGRVKSITHPAVGNHEYLTTGGPGCDGSNAGAKGYFSYFGASAGNAGQGYYSYDVGSWHIVALNSNCGDAGGCNPSSAQGQWLASDLAAHTNRCTLAYWHIPLFSSGGRANQNSQSFWTALYAAGADVILNGHDHTYERFAPQDPSGRRDDAKGIREFIVGTGGANHTSFTTIMPNSEVRDSSTYGILKLTLHSASYDWQFAPEAGATFTDSGTAQCTGQSDTTPPSPPSGLIAAPGQTGVGLSWSAASDDVAVTGYNVYVGGTRVGSTAATAYTASGLSCGTSYDFAVEAFDSAGNVSSRAAITASTSACLAPPLFGDDFESGDLSHWTTNLGLSADNSQVHSGTWAARAASSGGGSSTGYAVAQLSSGQASLYYKLWFKILGQGANVVDLLKLRTSTGTALLTLFASPTGVLGYQNNITTVSTYSKTTVTAGAWHSVEVHVVINDTTSQTETWLDGQSVPDLSKTESLGTTPIGRIQLGENITGRTYDVAFDDVTLTQSRASP
jgi:acid phosphatase type 7